MKKINKVIFLLTLFASSTCYSQKGRKYIGIEAGPSIISLRGNGIIKRLHKSAVGYAVNTSFQYNLNNIFSLHAGIGYERKGSKFSFIGSDSTGLPIGTINGYNRWNYLTVPVLLRATFGRKMNYFANAGPYFGYLLQQVYGDKSGPAGSVDNNNLDKDRRFDLGVSFGAGISIPILERAALSFEARNNVGLYNVSKVNVINDGTIKHNTTNFLFCFLYSINSVSKKE